MPTASSASAPRYLAAVAAKLWDRRSVIVDLPSGRSQHVPLGAELVEALAVGVAGLVVAHVAVERVTGVGDLAAGVRANRPDLARNRAAARPRRRLRRGESRPDRQARRRAVAHVRPVGFEQIEAAAAGVDERLAV